MSSTVRMFHYVPAPPTYDEVQKSLADHVLRSFCNPTLFCSNVKDVPEKPIECGGDILKICSNDGMEIEKFVGGFQDNGIYHWRVLLNALQSEQQTPDKRDAFLPLTDIKTYTVLRNPPSFKEVGKWDRTRQKMMKAEEIKKLKGNDDVGEKLKSEECQSTAIQDGPCVMNASKQLVSCEEFTQKTGEKSLELQQLLMQCSASAIVRSSSDYASFLSPHSNTRFDSSTPRLGGCGRNEGFENSPLLLKRAQSAVDPAGGDPKNTPTRRRASVDSGRLGLLSGPKRRRVSFEQGSETARQVVVSSLSRSGITPLQASHKRLLSPIVEHPGIHGASISELKLASKDFKAISYEDAVVVTDRSGRRVAAGAVEREGYYKQEEERKTDDCASLSRERGDVGLPLRHAVVKAVSSLDHEEEAEATGGGLPGSAEGQLATNDASAKSNETERPTTTAGLRPVSDPLPMATDAALSGSQEEENDVINSSQPSSPVGDVTTLKLRLKKPKKRRRRLSFTSAALDDSVGCAQTSSECEPPATAGDCSESLPPLQASAPLCSPPPMSPSPLSRADTPLLLPQLSSPNQSVSSVGDSYLRKLLLDTQLRRHYRLASQRSSPLLLHGQESAGRRPHDNTFQFRFTNHNLQAAKALHQHQHVGSLCLEAHVSCRGRLLPDPRHDAVLAVVLQGIRDSPPEIRQDAMTVVIGVGGWCRVGLPPSVSIVRVASEEELIQRLVSIVRTWDPDMLIGYEVQNSSWGYVLERFAAIGGADLVSQLSRAPSGDSTSHLHSHHDPELDQYGADNTSHIHVAGRIVLNVWRLMKGEVALQRYTLQNVAQHLLHTRVPEFSYDTLRRWWTDEQTQPRVLEHYLLRARLTLQLLERLDLVNRTSELARLFGIQFYDVLARGSQFRVESMLLRLSRSSNLVAVSPSVQQRANMNAPEWMALNLEPRSRLYTEPVAVLDFQSLYPSVMIAHNYCYSTCLGRVDNLTGSQPSILGTGLIKVSRDELKEMVDELHISPCGVAFVPKRVRRGIIPQMLEEILNTRIMVKQSMKLHKDDSTLQKVLHSRQLGLKLIANVTYGYTSANFSGRMPCVELADSVVSKGRETLERAIKLVNNHPSWGGTVVYGDTDSLFVHLPGKTKDQAFDIGQQIADVVTKLNPKPMKLRFEKVYLPCILQTKKRYVGYMYETRDQQQPEFEAKGIETVRRDGCPFTVQLLEHSLRLLFSCLDVSLVRRYLCRQLASLLAGHVSVQLLTFAKEYRGARGYRPGACVPALQLARQRIQTDPRAEPLSGERVPYVIVYGAPGLPLIRLVRCPSELLRPEGASLRPNYVYYATKAVLPALDRCFSLLGVDVMAWYRGIPRPRSVLPGAELHPGGRRAPCFGSSHGGIGGGPSTIAQYFPSASCALCGADTISTRLKKPSSTARDALGPSSSSSVLDDQGRVTASKSDGPAICERCRAHPQSAVLALNEKIRKAERAVDHISKVCRACLASQSPAGTCVSLDCPVTYAANTARRNLSSCSLLSSVLDTFQQ